MPVDRASPPLAHELEARRGVGNVHPFCLLCECARTVSQLSFISLRVDRHSHAIDVVTHCVAQARVAKQACM